MKGCITEKNGHLYVVFDVPREPGGKRRQIWRRVEGTRRDALRVLRQAMAEVEAGKVPPKGRNTVEDHLGKWLEWVKDRVQPRTYESYEEICRLHLVPALGKHQLAKLTVYQIEAHLAEKRKNLSARSVQYQFRVLSMALKTAVRWKLLSSNPCQDITPPPVKRAEARTLDAASAARLLSEAASTGLYLPILLAVSTGMRRGEICALKWGDIDLAGGVITVRQAAKTRHKDNNPEWYLGTPKAGKVAGVALPPSVVTILRETRGNAKESDFVTPTSEGGMLPPTRLTSAFRRLVKRLDLDITFHGLRHSHSTILLAAGVDLKTISEQLRHGGIGITMDIYGHVLPTTRQEAARRFDEALKAGKDQKG